MVDIREFFIWLLVGLCILLALVFGETFYNWYIFALVGIVSLGLVVVTPSRNQTRSLSYLLPFLIVSILSVVWTVNISYTLEHVSFLISAMTLSIAIQHVVSNKSREYWEVLLMVIASITAVLSLVLYIPGAENVIPDSTILYPGYGHMSTSILLVMSFPVLLSRYERLLKKDDREPTDFLVTRISLWMTVGGILITLSRTSILLTFGFVLYQFIQHLRSTDSIAKKIYQKLLLSYVPFVVMLVLLNVASLFFTSNQEWCNYIGSLENKVCKSVEKEGRTIYWQTALDVWRHQPLLGHGLGTYSLVYKKYSLINHYISSYPHNFYFKVMTELGLVGLFTVLYLFYSLLKSAYRSDDKTLFHVLILTSMYVFFNYSFSYYGVFLLLMIFTGITFAEVDTAHDTQKHKTRLVVAFLSLLTFILAVLYFSITMLIQNKKPVLAFKIFPYFRWHESYFIYELPYSYKAKLAVFNATNPPYLYRAVAATQDPVEKQLYYGFLEKADISSVAVYDLYRQYVADGNTEKFHLFLDNVIASEVNDQNVSFEKKVEIAHAALELGCNHLRDGENQQAADIFIKIYRLIPSEFYSVKEYCSDMKYDVVTLLRLLEPIDSGDLAFLVEASLPNALDQISSTVTTKNFQTVDRLITILVEVNSDHEHGIGGVLNREAETALEAGQADELYFVTSAIVQYDSVVEINYDLTMELADYWMFTWQEGQDTLGLSRADVMILADSLIDWYPDYTTYVSLFGEELEPEEILEYVDQTKGSVLEQQFPYFHQNLRQRALEDLSPDSSSDQD